MFKKKKATKKAAKKKAAPPEPAFPLDRLEALYDGKRISAREKTEIIACTTKPNEVAAALAAVDRIEKRIAVDDAVMSKAKKLLFDGELGRDTAARVEVALKLGDVPAITRLLATK